MLCDSCEVPLLVDELFRLSLHPSKPNSEVNGHDAPYGIIHAESHNLANVQELASDKATS